MWQVLGLTWLFLFKILEGFIGLLFHGYINTILIAVPVKVDTEVEFSFPVKYEFIVIFYGVN